MHESEEIATSQKHAPRDDTRPEEIAILQQRSGQAMQKHAARDDTRPEEIASQKTFAMTRDLRIRIFTSTHP